MSEMFHCNACGKYIAADSQHSCFEPPRCDHGVRIGWQCMACEERREKTEQALRARIAELERSGQKYLESAELRIAAARAVVETWYGPGRSMSEFAQAIRMLREVLK